MSKKMNKGKHTSNCPLPKIRWRDRVGTAWICRCGQVYRVDKVEDWDLSWKVWEKV